MTLINLSALTFHSNDPARLVEFYQREMGLPLEANTHGAIREHHEGLLNGVHFAFLRASPGLGGPIVPVFRVQSVDASTARMRKQGVEVRLKPVALGEGKRVAAFSDPDGNIFRLIEIDEAANRR